jgi:hypothetical protein
MNIHDIAKNQIEKTKKVYLTSPEHLFSEYNGEKENIKNYNGRQLLEMLQNADDAASEAKGDKKALIKLKGNQLIIANTGYPFSEAGLRSIFHSHLSPKQAKDNQIGKKGLGFRSILSWSDNVIIKSAGACIAFSTEFSRSVLQELLEDNAFKIHFDELNINNYTSPISTLVCPKIIVDDTLEDVNGYDTAISIELHENAIEEVKHQINNDLDSEVLLFLNNLEFITIDIDGVITTYEKDSTTPGRVRIINTGTDGRIEKEWNIKTLSGRFEDIDRPFELSVAWNDGLTECKNVMYTFFRTKVPITFKGIIHGTFELNADRNLIIKDVEKYNERLLSLLPELIAQTSEYIASTTSPVSYVPINFLNISLPSLNHLTEEKIILAKIKEAARALDIFPTIDGTFISWAQQPAFYLDEVISRHASPEVFPEMLLWSEDQFVLGIISGHFKYDLADLVEDIVETRNTVDTSQYAELVYAIHKLAAKEGKLAGKALFYDRNNMVLDFSEPIFLPDTKGELDFPKEISLQVIHSELASALLKETGQTEYSELSKTLNYFNLKQYEFPELVEILITHYGTNPTKENIIELHKQLFKIYEDYGNLEEKWSGTPIQLLGKKGNITNAGKLYLGREYGYPFNDEIYHYDKAKIAVASKKMEMDHIPAENWKKYLLWAGAATYPRLFYKKVETDYADFVMKRFNFKNPISGRHFSNYKDFKSNLNSFGQIKVVSIDDLDNILSKNSSEKILQLINNSNTIFKLLEDNKEMKGSHIYFNIAYAKKYYNIDGGQMPSFLAWKLKNTAWLDTDSGNKAKPGNCSTAAYITEEFQGLVEKPKMDLEVLGKAGITRDKLDLLLVLVGVHKTINTFPTGLLFSILLNLPAIDAGGKKTKTIYNQLTANYEEKGLDQLDKDDPDYQNYQKSGKVLCKNGEFLPYGQVYYVNDKRYGESITGQFPTIDIDRRRGKEKIRKLFAVKPLDNIQLTVTGEPGTHPLDMPFISELESFKPYVYVLRKEMDGGNEKNVIKDTRFRLVTSLELNLEKDQTNINLDIGEYEYFYDKGKRTVFICAPDNYRDIFELKDDIHICLAIAEAFAAILDVDAQRQQIRELFSKSGNVRDELLRAELDDHNLQKLNEARKVLGIINDPKLDFWSSFTKCFNRKKLNFRTGSDQELQDKLSILFPKYITAITTSFDQINYAELNDEASSEAIVSLFKEASITIEKFNTFHYPPVDLSELYKLAFKMRIEQHKDKFTAHYYIHCAADNSLKGSFVERLGQYQFLQPTVVNELAYQAAVDADFAAAILRDFKIDMDQDSVDIDITEKQQASLRSFWAGFAGSENEKTLFSQFLGENPRSTSLLYFEDQVGAIAKTFTEWMGQKKEPGKTASGTPSKRITFGTKVILYEDLNDLKKQVDIIIAKDGLKGVTTTSIKTLPQDVQRTGGTGILKSGSKPKVPKEEIGFLGEYIVYQHLLNTIENKESIKWVSDYARLCGINVFGRDGYGYDIEYIPNGGKHPRQVEVKVVGHENAFHMSSFEVQFGETNKKHHEIFLVRNLENPTAARIERISNLFDYKGKSFTNNDLFTVVNDNFIIKFKKPL